MAKTLVAYFSASGVTKALAERIAKTADADIFEIRPEIPYTPADLNWRDDTSRSSVEMKEKPEFRPPMADPIPDISGYERVLLGFPIWWYVAPTIVNTFLEGGDFSGRQIALFATSGSSGMGSSWKHLAASAKGAVFAGEIRFESDATDQDIEAWLQSL